MDSSGAPSAAEPGPNDASPVQIPSSPTELKPPSLPESDELTAEVDTTMRSKESSVATVDADAAPPAANRQSFYYRLSHSPSFGLFVVASAICVDTLVYSIIIPILPFMYANLGYPLEGGDGHGGVSSSTLIGIMIALFGVGILVSSPVYGIISDKFKNRRWPMVAGLAAQIVAILVFMFANSLGLVYFARFLQGVAGASIWVVGLAFISDIFPEHELGRAMGTAFIGLNIGTLIGPTIGGVLYQYLGYKAPFIFNCIMLAIDLVLRMIVAEPDHSLERHQRTGFGTTSARATEAQKDAIKAAADGVAELNSTIDAKDALGNGVQLQLTATIVSDTNVKLPPPQPLVCPERTLHRTKLQWIVVRKSHPSFWDLLLDPCVMLICWLCVVGGVGFGAIEAAMPLHLASEPFFATPSIIGFVMLAMVIPNSVSAAVSGWLRDMYGSKWVLYIGLILTAITAPMVAIPGTYWGICLALGFYGIVAAAGVAPSLPELSILVPETAAGKVYSIFNICFALVGRRRERENKTTE